VNVASGGSAACSPKYVALVTSCKTDRKVRPYESFMQKHPHVKEGTF
jgi:hypothetical protein